MERVSLLEMGPEIRVQILDKVVYIFTLRLLDEGRSINPTILPPAVGKYYGRRGSLYLVWQPIWEKDKWIQTSCVHGQSESYLDGGIRLWSYLERDGFR